MGKNYDQLDIDERYELYRLYESGISVRAIGRLMGRSASTISRELRRNSFPRGEYKPGSADRIALSRCRRLSRIECLSPLRSYISDGLAMGWSPEQIAGRLRLERSKHIVSVETIYRFLYRPAIRRAKLYRFLPRAKASRGRRYFKRRRAPIEGRRSIHDRPEAVTLREEFGHWEGDLMQFRTQRGNLLTLSERKTRFTLAAPLKSKTAEETGDLLIALLNAFPPKARKTITFDNGGEFAHYHKLTSELGMEAYFCDPHSPWQRGLIENTNGILRRDMPRKTDMKNYSPQDIDELLWAVNSTPRKCLGYKTPAEAFMQNMRCCT
ncbi:IS30 family transposase [uncultured Kiloniella sp.]|uniref:IS30 family transposase n=1 Tax=uncultured Kiloniella sp. TaxID=1133091 RepID=UPI00263547FA|nr:IS30 family transposase [uncultured Kiloniella sp.]